MQHISHDQRVLDRTGSTAPTGLRLKVLPVAIALCFCPALWAGINDTAVGLPMGGTVAAGTVLGGVTDNQLTLTQTGSRAVIDWQSFNINAGKTVQFKQDSATSAVLNRVPASAGLSEIYGTLTANGMVLLMNPNGVLFGAGASINVGSLIATTGTVNQAGFMGGGAFAISGATTGSVSNQGTITAQSAGLVALVAPSVSNQGVITATGGRIALSGADRATVSLNGGLYEFAVDAGALGTNASISNAAGASLDGATIFMSTGDAANLLSGVINLQGVQHATSAIVVNGNTVVLKSDLDAPAISGNSSSIQVQAGASIQDAVKIAKTGTPGAGATVDVQVGTYAEQVTPTKELVTLNKANLTLIGHDGAKLLVPDLAEVNGILISANNVTVQGLEIAGPISAPYNVYYRTEPGYVTPTGISRGIVVSKDMTGFTLRNNSIHDVRTGVLINGINNTGSVSANTIENTKSGISVQYTDAAGVTIADNREGATGNEWGLNLHLNGHLVGGAIVNNSTPIAAAPTSSWQQSLLNLSTSNNGWAVQDQGYTASNRTHANVATSGAATNQGSQLTPINTIQGGVNAVVPGGKVYVKTGSYVENVSITKALTLKGAGGGNSNIDPASGNAVTVSGAIGASSSVLIDGFTFRDAPGAGVSVASGTTLGQLTIQNSDFLNNGKYGFFVDGSSTAGVPGLANVSLLNSTFEGNGADFSVANSLGQGAIVFNYYNGNATLRDLAITGNTEFVGVQIRGYHDASGGAVHDAGRWEFDNITFGGTFRRPSASFNGVNWNPDGPGDAMHILEYASVANMSFNNVKLNQTVGHGMFLEGLSSTLNVGNTTFAVPDGTITGTGASPTRSMNIVAGYNVQNNVKTNVDATHASFTGASNGFAIEDRVGHALDVTGLGLVTWNAGNVYVTPTSGSVQRGIDAASAGNTVNVAAGTYAEAPTITKSLTLQGDTSVSRPLIELPDGTSGTLTIQASNVTVQGLQINKLDQGSDTALVTIPRGGSFPNYTIAYSDIRLNDLAFSKGRRAAYITGQNVTIENSTFSEQLRDALYFDAVAGTTTIRNNQFSGATGSKKAILIEGFTGVPASSGTVNVTGNTLDGKDNFFVYNSWSDPASRISLNLTNNRIISTSDNGIAIYDPRADQPSFDPASFAKISSMVVAGNDLSGVAAGKYAAVGVSDANYPVTVNASGNWWGPTSEVAVLAKTNGPVDISPFLMSGTDTAPGTPGFQGAASNVTVTALGAHSGIGSRIQEGIHLVDAGGTVNVGAGNYSQPSTLDVDKSLTLAGAGQSSTAIDARSVPVGSGMNVSADNVTLRDFSFYGPVADANSSVGISVAPTGGAAARLLNFSISNVTSRGAGRAELELNGVNGALINGVTLDGAPVAGAGTTSGSGLHVLDSANVTIRNSSTQNNADGGVAIHQANLNYDQQVSGITIEGNNVFGELNPVSLRNESTTQNLGALSTAGLDYAVGNAGTTQNAQYTWLQATQQKAFDFSVNLANPTASYVRGWTGSTATQNFQVGIGNLTGGGTQAMAIGAALGNAGSGANIDVSAGTYPENVTVNSRYNLRFNDAAVHGLTLNTGASDSGISGKVTADTVTGLVFNAPVKLLADTTLATNGGNITLNGHVQNANGVQYSLTLAAGSGSNRGDVSMTTGGSESNPLNQFEVTANRFNLSDTLWVQRYKINALGNVALSNHTLRAMDADGTNTLTTTGSVTGATTSKGSVEVVSSGDVSANVTTDGKATVAANNISGNISSKSSVDLVGSGDVSANVVADGKTTVTANNISGSISSKSSVDLVGSGDVSSNIVADGKTTVTANNITGNISGSDVAVTAQKKVDVVVTATNSAALSGATVAGTVSAPTAAVDSGSSVQLALNTTTATVHAAGDVSLSGTSSSVTIDAPTGSVSGNFDTVNNTGNGVVSVNGQPELNPVLVSQTANSRVIPVGSSILANTAANAIPDIGLTRVAASSGEQINRSTVAGAGDSIDRGQSVVIDLSPGNAKEQK